mmetsp:Transcript_14160/g.34065  ORF Transcript_14160/g.34065 Transcript_14160/m.34065 type:complete len:489 (-) Transcript_14160:182-1648(-)|eukprot:CAMPEP_0197591202 /NCGR_PEP_ID=MMETSP1326-20131121/12935_1 /TAXON_ID=1155430 /ORGANISM="Genus nov. species nov., Strain RCC2288" /LENGTH=488 /DNA_ID=CAMNT_0043156585 /DNA_START=366 /DNA_END=1832 /DNA_ORIENTATION=-
MSTRLVLTHLADDLHFVAVHHLGEHRLGHADAVLERLGVGGLIEHQAHLALEGLERHGAAHDDARGARGLAAVHGAPVVEHDALALLQRLLQRQLVAVGQFHELLDGGEVLLELLEGHGDGAAQDLVEAHAHHLAVRVQREDGLEHVLVDGLSVVADAAPERRGLAQRGEELGVLDAHDLRHLEPVHHGVDPGPRHAVEGQQEARAAVTHLVRVVQQPQVGVVRRVHLHVAQVVPLAVALGGVALAADQPVVGVALRVLHQLAEPLRDGVADHLARGVVVVGHALHDGHAGGHHGVAVSHVLRALHRQIGVLEGGHRQGFVPQLIRLRRVQRVLREVLRLLAVQRLGHDGRVRAQEARGEVVLERARELHRDRVAPLGDGDGLRIAGFHGPAVEELRGDGAQRGVAVQPLVQLSAARVDEPPAVEQPRGAVAEGHLDLAGRVQARVAEGEGGIGGLGSRSDGGGGGSNKLGLIIRLQRKGFHENFGGS